AGRLRRRLSRRLHRHHPSGGTLAALARELVDLPPSALLRALRADLEPAAGPAGPARGAVLAAPAERGGRARDCGRGTAPHPGAVSAAPDGRAPRGPGGDPPA